MPIINRDQQPITALATGSLAEPQIDVAPDTQSIFRSAFRQNNILGSFATHLWNLGSVSNEPDPGYSAWDDIKGTPYEDHWHAFATSNNRRYTDALKRQVDQEDSDRRTLAAGGITSLVADLSAGILDPTILIPVGGEVAKARQGYRLLQTFRRTATAGALGTAAQETGLQLTQETRPLSESATNIGFGAVLGGLLGTGVAAVLSKPERELAERGFDKLVKAYGEPANASVGAAQASQSLGLEALTVDGSAVGKMAEASQFLNPGLRLNFSPSPVARQVGQELAEGSLYQVGHAEGLTTGASVERLAGMTERARTATGMTQLNQAFMDMRRAGESMSFDEFDQAVGRAMRNDDVGENEFISRAAKDLRGSIVEPFFEDGKAVGLYDDTDRVAFAPSYFPRQYRSKVLIANEPQIKAQWRDYMGGLIGGKYREALTRFQAERQDFDSAIDDLSLSPAKRQKALSAIEAERQRLLTDSPDHAERLTALEDAQATEATAKESGDKAALRKAQDARRALKKEGGEEFAGFLDAHGKLAGRLARLKVTDKATAATMRDELVAAKAEAQRAFLDRWEIQHMGEGVDLDGGRADFSNMAREIVDEIYDKLTGRDYGDSGSIAPEYMTPIKRGPLKERTLPIPDSMLTAQGVLEDRASDVLRRYSRTLAADVELTRKFGSPRLDDQLKKIADEYAKLREGVTDPDALRKLDDRQKADQRDIEAMRDLIRGNYKREANSNGFARVSRVATHFNFITKLGGVVVSSLSDIARPAMVHGLGRFMSEGVAPLIHNFEAVKLSVAEARLAGTVTERVLQHRIMALSSMADPLERGTPIERAMEAMSRFAAKWTGMPIWNDSMKGISSILSQNRILDPKLSDRRTLAFLGIDPDMEAAIRTEFKAHGEIMDGVHIANTQSWTNQEAVRAFRAAVGKDVDSIIVTPGTADLPLMSHTPTGRMLLQFKSYTLSSHQKVLLRGLQEGKGKFVSGMVGMTSLGMLSAMLKAWRAGENRWEKFKRASENPGYVIGEGLDNAGVFALPFDVANTTEKLGEPMHFSFNPIKTPMMAAGQWANPEASTQGKSIRYSTRGPLGALLGPSAGLTEDAFQAGAAASDKIRSELPGDRHGKPVPRGEVNAAWRLLPFNSFYGMREAIQAINGDSPYLSEDAAPMVTVGQAEPRPAATDAM